MANDENELFFSASKRVEHERFVTASAIADCVWNNSSITKQTQNKTFRELLVRDKHFCRITFQVKQIVQKGIWLLVKSKRYKSSKTAVQPRGKDLYYRCPELWKKAKLSQHLWAVVNTNLFGINSTEATLEGLIKNVFLLATNFQLFSRSIRNTRCFRKPDFKISFVCVWNMNSVKSRNVFQVTNYRSSVIWYVRRELNNRQTHLKN